MKKKATTRTSIDNSRARFDYAIESTYSAGIALSGAEAKSLRMGHGILRGSYVQIKDDGAWLINMQVNPLKTNIAHLPEADRTRSRRLLLKQRELEQMKQQKDAGRQIVPLRLHVTGKFIKIELGVGKGKKSYDKRQTIKKRDEDRTIRRNLKHA